jgi:uncharacterized protein
MPRARWGRTLALASVLALGGGSAVQAASFSCSGTLTPVERMVCKDPEVSALDDHMARYHGAARQVLRYASDCLVADQRGWLRNVRNVCTDTRCLKMAYLRRLSELDGLQPGATASKTLFLPAVPTLVWIIPAAADQTAAPRVKGLRLLEAKGRLVNDVTAGDGYVVQTAAGQKHVVVSSMFIDESTEMLNALGNPSGATYLVRGNQEPGAPADSLHFAQNSCRYIYRLPE